MASSTPAICSITARSSCATTTPRLSAGMGTSTFLETGKWGGRRSYGRPASVTTGCACFARIGLNFSGCSKWRGLERAAPKGRERERDGHRGESRDRQKSLADVPPLPTPPGKHAHRVEDVRDRVVRDCSVKPCRAEGEARRERRRQEHEGKRQELGALRRLAAPRSKSNSDSKRCEHDAPQARHQDHRDDAEQTGLED